MHRDIDETGMSGTGVVAQGVEFGDGTVAMQWSGAYPTSVVFHGRGIEGVIHLHSHEGKTRLVFLDTMPTNAPRDAALELAPEPTPQGDTPR